MSRSKFWCFTENNNPDSFRGALGLKEGIKFICGQLEIASTGQRHFQGYVQLTVSKPLSWVRNNISDTAHWEISRGSSTSARDYCKKVDETTVPDTYVEFGEFTITDGRRGARTDINAYRDAIVGGATKRTLIETQPLEMAKYDRFYHTVRSVFKPKRVRETEFKVVLYYGDPGTGKTRKAYEDFPDLYEVPVSNGPLWMDGYDNHEVVLIDDFMGRGSKMSLDNTLKLLDRYVRQVPIKGGHTWWMPETIIVTTNYHPRAWYKWDNRESSFAALARRFHEVYVFEDEDQIAQDPEEFFYDRDLWPELNVHGEYQ